MFLQLPVQVIVDAGNS